MPKSVEASGTVKTESKEFQWNLGRLFYKQKGETAAYAAAVRILSVVFILPVVVTAIVDLGRRFGYAAGLCNGKSWSLIDTATGACKSVANKVHAMFFAPQKKLTEKELQALQLEQANRRSAGAIRAHVIRLVDGFNALNGGYFHNNVSFTTPTALNANAQIRTAKEALAKEVEGYVMRNAKTPEEFGKHYQYTLEVIFKFLRAEAKDQTYFAKKTERNGDEPPVYVQAFNEVVAYCKPVIGERFVELAKKEPDLAKSLKSGVDHKVLTADQAKEVFGMETAIAYNAGLQSGFAEANQKRETMLNSGVQHQLITEEERQAIDDQMQPTVKTLSYATARDIVQQQNIEDEASVMCEITKVADILIDQNKLPTNQQTVFTSETKSQLRAVKLAIETEKQAARAGQTAAELHAQEQEKLAKAQKAAQDQKAASQTALLKDLRDLLEMIAQKQDDLDVLFKKRNDLVLESNELTVRHSELSRMKVMVDGKEMFLFEAAARHHRTLHKIYGSDTLSDTQKAKAINKLNTKTFGKTIYEAIGNLNTLGEQIAAKANALGPIFESIQNEYKKLTNLMNQYYIFANNNKLKLEAEQQKEISHFAELLRAKKEGKEGGIDAMCKMIHIPIEKIKVNKTNPAVNDDVATLLKEWRKDQADALQAKQKAEVKPSAPPEPEKEEDTVEEGATTTVKETIPSQPTFAQTAKDSLSALWWNGIAAG